MLLPIRRDGVYYRLLLVFSKCHPTDEIAQQLRTDILTRLEILSRQLNLYHSAFGVAYRRLVPQKVILHGNCPGGGANRLVKTDFNQEG